MDFDINRLLSKRSSHHHYIPRFLIEGFTNPNGFLYVFDKKENRISNRTRSAKSIFYENDRNTIEVTPNKSSSILEDEFYSKVDNQGSRIIKYLQNEKLDEINFSTETTAQLLVFLITLFWRIPFSDFAAKDILERSDITAHGIDPAILKSDPTFQKMERARLFMHTVNEMKNFGKGGKVSVNIHEHQKDIYVIGDNPVLFKKVPDRFTEFGEIDFLIAVSSRRLYSSTEVEFSGLTGLNSYTYNAAVINQSVRYVGCCDCGVLEKSVQLYTEFKKRGIQFTLREDAFKSNLQVPVDPSTTV